MKPENDDRSAAADCSPAPRLEAGPEVDAPPRSRTKERRCLVLPLKRRWFEAIKDGSKIEEYRLDNEYWRKRLEGKDFDEVTVTLGYPRRDDTERRLTFPWLGAYRRMVTSDEWGGVPKMVWAIRLGTKATPSECSEDEPCPDCFGPTVTLALKVWCMRCSWSRPRDMGSRNGASGSANRRGCPARRG